MSHCSCESNLPYILSITICVEISWNWKSSARWSSTFLHKLILMEICYIRSFFFNNPLHPSWDYNIMVYMSWNPQLTWMKTSLSICSCINRLHFFLFLEDDKGLLTYICKRSSNWLNTVGCLYIMSEKMYRMKVEWDLWSLFGKSCWRPLPAVCTLSRLHKAHHSNVYFQYEPVH